VSRDRADELRAVLAELHAVEDERCQIAQQRRIDAHTHVRAAVRRIADIASPDGILARAASELGAGWEFDRVLVSAIRSGTIVPHSLWARSKATSPEPTIDQLQARTVRLAYPLAEAEVAKTLQPQVVDLTDAGRRSPAPLREILGWREYVLAAVALDGRAVGLVHADASDSGRRLDPLDREVAARYADGLGRALEIAVLQRTLQTHRNELWTAVRWMTGRLEQAENVAAFSDQPSVSDTVDTLTPREHEVLKLMGRGMTNHAIANRLVISEGTAKYHVKNILRKLHATNRADAVARALRAVDRDAP
jgi:DNA-binding CsgD family transcriptional regulator